MFLLTVLGHRAQDALQDVIVDDDVKETEWVEVAMPDERGKGCSNKHLVGELNESYDSPWMSIHTQKACTGIAYTDCHEF